MHKRIGRIRVLLRLTVLLCGLYLAWYAVGARRQKNLQAELLQSVTQAEEKAEEDGPRRVEETAETVPGAHPQTEEEILEAYAGLKRQNEDLAGWLSITGTQIQYPVMRSEDDEYYLEHNFNREKSRHGSLFVKSRVDTRNPGTNFIIYGHNMKDGTMFGSLDAYRDREFWETHRELVFSDLYETRAYQVMAAFEAKVYGETEEGFRYYEFYRADTEEEFREFYEQVKSLSIYETDVTAEYGDVFLTLSTCAYHTQDGRFVVVAKYEN